MQLVKVAQFSNKTVSFPLFAAAAVAAVFWTIIVPLTSVYVTLKLHKLDFNIEVLTSLHRLF